MQSAIAQHHDGISGTARKVVVDNYIERLDNGVDEVASVVPPLMQQQLLYNHSSSAPPTISLDNNFLSHLKSGTTAPVILYNSLGRIRYEYVHIKIPTGTPLPIFPFSNISLSSHFLPPFLFLSFTLAKIAFLPPSQCPFCPPSLSSFLSHPSLLYLFSLPFPILFPTPPLSFFSLPFPFFLPTPLAICCGMIIPSHPAAIPIPHSPFSRLRIEDYSSASS